jgi:hypothetical protein
MFILTCFLNELCFLQNRTGRLRTGDFFQTSYATCDEFQAAYSALCKDCLSGGMSGIAHVPLMPCSDNVQMPLM